MDVVLYFFVIQGYLRYRRLFEIPKISNPAEAFAYFERTYKELFPQEQDGFTWGEAIMRANNVAKLKDVEWQKVQESLKQYEAERYGGIEGVQIDPFPILKLSISIREKIYTT